MQLKKSDVRIFKGIPVGKGLREDIKYLDYSKFLEVREFYEKYKDKDADFFWEEEKEIFNNVYLKYLECRYEKLFPELVINLFHDWLFSYCFKDGLKSEPFEKPKTGKKAMLPNEWMKNHKLEG